MPLTPNNREEHWLQGMVDGETTLEPNKRREYWYKEIVDAIGSGGGGGTGGGVLVVDIDRQTLTLDKTWNEITNANSAVIKAGVGPDSYVIMQLVSYFSETNNYEVVFRNMVTDERNTFSTDSADGYPVLNMG